MRRAFLALTLIALAACGGGGDNATTTTAPDAAQVPPADARAVTITGVDLGTDQITIRGEAPTPCNGLGSFVRQPGDTIEVFVWAEPLGPEETCIQVIEPFEITLSFDPPDTDTSVTVNGEEIGRVFP